MQARSLHGWKLQTDGIRLNGFANKEFVFHFIYSAEEKCPLTTHLKTRRMLYICLLLILLALLALYLVCYPHVFYRYLDTLPDAGACRIEVYNGSDRLELEEAQRAELLRLMKELKYGSAYGPCTLSEEYFGAPAGAVYYIYVRSPGAGDRQRFVIQTCDPSHTGFFQKSSVLPIGHWLTVQDTGEVFAWLEALNGPCS